MKKIIIGIITGSFLTVLLAASTVNYQLKKSTAEVEQIEGLYIFSDSKPVLEYEYLGTVKASIGWDTQYQGVRNKLIKKAKKDFPNADGLIFHFKSGGTDRCDAIKIK